MSRKKIDQMKKKFIRLEALAQTSDGARSGPVCSAAAHPSAAIHGHKNKKGAFRLLSRYPHFFLMILRAALLSLFSLIRASK